MRMKVASPKINLAAMTPAVQEAVGLTLKAHASIILNAAKRRIARGPKTGRVYRKRGVDHRASAPGEPPATDTGRLIASGVSDGDVSGAFVRFDTVYAAPLEFGTARIQPRPYLVPSAEEDKPEREADIRAAVVKGATQFMRKGAKP